MDAWVEEERELAGPCPRCGANDAKPIAYGLPDVGTHERLSGVVVFAGCCVPEQPPRFACGRCDRTWGDGGPWT